MLATWVQLFVELFTILFAAITVTNALEYLGERMHISAGVTGSIFAAVSTALPETMIPILAIFAGTSDHAVNEEISVGAILGAPLMLATLSIFLMSLAALPRRGLRGFIRPEHSGFVRDMNFYLFAFICSAIAMYIPHHDMITRVFISFVLVFLYIFYLFRTFTASKQLVSSGHVTTTEDPLLITLLKFPVNLATIIFQLLLGLALLLAGAKLFIGSIHAISIAYQVSPLVLSLIIVPVATELPEKVNSILWVRKAKDTLAVGNITGAMVFQGSLLPAIGILMTPWQLSSQVFLGMLITFLAAIWLRLNATKKGIMVAALFVNGLLYVSYLAGALYFT